MHTAVDLKIGQEHAKPNNLEQALNGIGCYRANLKTTQAAFMSANQTEQVSRFG
jgi:hypothetical protein